MRESSTRWDVAIIWSNDDHARVVRPASTFITAGQATASPSAARAKRYLPNGRSGFARRAGSRPMRAATRRATATTGPTSSVCGGRARPRRPCAPATRVGRGVPAVRCGATKADVMAWWRRSPSTTTPEHLATAGVLPRCRSARLAGARDVPEGGAMGRTGSRRRGALHLKREGYAAQLRRVRSLPCCHSRPTTGRRRLCSLRLQSSAARPPDHLLVRGASRQGTPCVLMVMGDHPGVFYAPPHGSDGAHRQRATVREVAA